MSDLTTHDISTTPAETQMPNWLQRPLLAALTIDWEKVIYLVFVVAAIITRFWDLGSRVMSHDESLHTQFSYQYYNGEGYFHTPLMHGPFLFHLTAIFYWLFGPSDFVARAPVAILGVILVIVPYFLRGWIGRVGALFASFFLLVSPYITYYSRYIRHDIYVIMWALIVFVAMWFYLHKREEKYLWWFAGGTALMFSTKEVAFIYVAIFGSLLIMRLLLQMWRADWLRTVLPRMIPPGIMVAVAVAVLGFGGIYLTLASAAPETAVVTPTDEGFAANPLTDTAVAPTDAPENNIWVRWLVIGGIALLSAGLFVAADRMRPYIDNLPEFDLVVLFTSLVLPMASPILVIIMGWNPRDYSMSTCMLEGQETMSSLQLLFGRMSQSMCWSAFWESGMVRSGGFLLITLIVGVLVGLWWHGRRWLTAAAVFHAIFLVLYTSVFTNPGGWASGMIGSLGYWWEQHDVQRGNQPLFYYLFVMPFYEFMPLIFTMLAVRLWAKRQRLNRVIGYWLTLILAAILVESFAAWVYGRSYTLANQTIPELTGPLGRLGLNAADLVGLLTALILVSGGILFWFFIQRRRLLAAYDTTSLMTLASWRIWLEFVPAVTWWFIATFVAYSIAGEKMPWLSTHFVIPMVFLAGWYFNEKLKGHSPQSLLARTPLLLLGLSMLLIIVALLALGPLLLGQIEWGNQTQQNLSGIGRFLGSLVTLGILIYFWRQTRARTDLTVRQPVMMLSIFGLLTLLTVRFNYMANWPNADYTTEFMVYAHGAPATKDVVLQQVEELSMRMYGDKSIRVAFDNDVSWPYTWYLRDYPNRYYFGESPNQSLNDSPIILVGSLNWLNVEPYLGNNYEARTYTFLWWPMEEYRKIGWSALVGNPNDPVRRGLGNADVRQALWDIFFYRDYKKYGEVFGGEYTAARWPLRHELRVYIRKDALVNLWDYGIGAVNATGLEDPYAEGELQVVPLWAINETGVAGIGEGQLFTPRNMVVAPNGRLYVADSGNHRIQVFDADSGEYLDGWGTFGTEPGQFNEPWGLTATDDALYVADTWNHRIQKFSLEGELLGAYGRSGSASDEPETGGLGLFFGPRDIVALADGRFLITDTGNHRFQVMDADGNFLSQTGGFGNFLGQMNEPVGITTAPDGSVFLADTWNGRVQQFSPDLIPFAEWPVSAWFGQSINNKPYITTDGAGRVYLTDPENFRILIFSQFGDYIGRFGQFGTDLNSLGLPNGITTDADNNLYIADANNNRIIKYPAIFAPEPVEDAPPPAEAPAESEDGE